LPLELPEIIGGSGALIAGGCPPFRGGAVWAGDEFHQVAVRVVEIQAAAAVEVVDLAAAVAVEIGVERDAGRVDARQRGVEFRLADEEGVVQSAETGDRRR
jgi:hypothetical protein